MPRLTIEEWPEPIEAAKATLLDAALKAGVPYPHGCRTGECGNCKSRLIAGEISHGSCDPNALTPAERQAGLILPCRARAKTDVVLSWQHGSAVIGPKRLITRIESLERVTPDVMVVRLHPEARLDFKAGQFANLRFGRYPPRSYSMANHPDEDRLEFHVRLLPSGLISRHVAKKAKIGDVVEVEGPFGEAYLQEQAQAPLIALAGGTGLAPVRSIIEKALSIGWNDPIQVWAGFRSKEHLYGDVLFDAWRSQRVDVRVCLDETPSPDGAGSLYQVFSDCADICPETRVYIAGSPAFVKAIKCAAITRGARPHNVFADPFVIANSNASRSSGIRALIAACVGKWS